MKIRIDPEFQNKIPPLTEAEFKQLEDNILSAGRIYESIKIWNGVIVDGHNRWKILLKHPNKKIRYEIQIMEFADKYEAFDWMYKNQLGRRNLTDEQKTYLLGKLYEARKHTAAFRGNQYVDESGRAQNEHKQIGRVSGQIAQEQGVGQETVKRAGAYAKGIDDIRKIDSSLADEILTGRVDVPKAAVQNVGKMPDDQKEIAVNAIRDGKPITGRKETREAKAIALAMEDETVTMEFTLDHLLEQMKCNADGFVNSLSNMLMDHRDICNDNRTMILEAIDEIITKRIDLIKERLNDGTQL